MKFQNFSIRLLEEQDIDPYYKLVQKNRPRLEAFFTGTTSKTKTYADTQKFLSEMVQRTKEKTYFPYVIIDDTSNTIAGFLDLKNIDWNIPKSELGCYIDEDYEGKGISSEAVKVFCDFCFLEYKFKKMFLRTHPSNAAARSIAEKCGFEVEGILRREYKTTSGEIIDLIYYGRLN